MVPAPGDETEGTHQHGKKKKAISEPNWNVPPEHGIIFCLFDMCTGGRGFESHLSSLFSMKIEKRALRFVSLPYLCSLKFTCIHSIWSVVSLVV